MKKLMDVASYIYIRYKRENNVEIDEMKLHKLLYLSQRESLILNDEILFNADFYAWKYGPVLKEIRGVYKQKSFLTYIPDDINQRLSPIMDYIFKNYSHKNSWSLSRLTHGEISWKLSRRGIPDGENGDNIMKIDDIRKDAERIRTRRAALMELGLL